MIIELRRYFAVPGRLDVSLDRFRNHLPELYARHGIQLVQSWIATSGQNAPMFMYMTVYENAAARESQWKAFFADEDWWKVRALTQGTEESVQRYALELARVVWPDRGLEAGFEGEGIDDIIHVESLVGQTAAALRFLSDDYLAVLAEHGAKLLFIGELTTGERLPGFVAIVRWRDAADRARGWEAHALSTRLQKSYSEQRRSLGGDLLGQSIIHSASPIAH